MRFINKSLRKRKIMVNIVFKKTMALIIIITLVKEKPVKADLHSANFSRANDTFRWRMFSFLSPFENNEIWIIRKATCFKQKTNYNKKP